MNKEVGRRKSNKPQRLGRAGSGFALVAALLAIWILTAVGILVFTVSTQDLRVSTRLVGEKKAFAAVETGVHVLTQIFNYESLSASRRDRVVADTGAGGDRDSLYTIETPRIPTSSEGPAVILYPGFSASEAEKWGRTRYLANVTGENTRYGSRVQVNTGIGYGPINVSTEHR